LRDGYPHLDEQTAADIVATVVAQASAWTTTPAKF
jgi:hypothetical protein